MCRVMCIVFFTFLATTLWSLRFHHKIFKLSLSRPWNSNLNCVSVVNFLREHLPPRLSYVMGPRSHLKSRHSNEKMRKKKAANIWVMPWLWNQFFVVVLFFFAKTARDVFFLCFMVIDFFAISISLCVWFTSQDWFLSIQSSVDRHRVTHKSSVGQYYPNRHWICDYLELHVEAMAFMERGRKKIRNDMKRLLHFPSLWGLHVTPPAKKSICTLPHSYNVCRSRIPFNAAFTFDDNHKATSSPLSLLIWYACSFARLFLQSSPIHACQRSPVRLAIGSGIDQDRFVCRV